MMSLRKVATTELFASVLTHPPRLIYCPICEGRRIAVRTQPHPVPGTRCLGCRSTAVHRGLWTILQARYGSDLHRLAGRAVYEMSAHGAFHDALRRCSATHGFTLSTSEFLDGVEPGSLRDGIRCENVESLTYPDHSFDLVTSTDVFEHVEDDIRGFREIARVLKPGGRLIFTVPFNEERPTLIRGVRRADGTLEHLEPPEYHGDPMRGMSVYTWRTYGTDICDRLSDAGLTAQVELVSTSGVSLRSPVIVAHVSG